MTKGKNKLLRYLALALCLLLLCGQAAVAAPAVPLAFTPVDAGLTPGDLVNPGAGVSGGQDMPAAEEVVRATIVLDEPSLLDKGYSTLGLSGNLGATAYANLLEAGQVAVERQIENQALAEQNLDVIYRFSIGVNALAVSIPYGKLDAVAQVDGVKEVILENRYLPEETPDTATSGEMVGAYSAWAGGYTGAGSRVAIIDTGIDPDHPSFTEEGFLYGLALSAAQFGGEVADYGLLTVEEVETLMPRLHVSEMLPGVTAEELYTSQKIPFGFNYIMATTDYANDATSGDHGCHVAGIATANTYVPYTDEDGDEYYAPQALGVTGVAPNAQVLAMKVFSDGWGAYDSDYMAALEDAILLGCDAVNLSLGSTAAGRSYNTTYADLLASLVESDTVVTFSGGNNGAWSDNNLTGTGLNLTTDVRMHTGGSPGSYTNAFTVASVTNSGLTGIVGEYNGYRAVANDTSASYGFDPFEALDTSAEQSGTTYDYVFLGDPVTKTGIYGAEADFAGLDLTGKIVLISRGGDVSFFEKANRAVEAGAAATVVYNNVDGTLNMDMTSYAYTAPAVILSLADSQAILAASTQDESGVWGGQVTITGTLQTVANLADGYKPSSFSSWGVTENLALKPEIIAPGGNIYSTTDNGTYGNNSGTSMAAPSVAGAAAVVAQYIRENGLAETTGLNTRTLAIALLMSTAEPLLDGNGLPYSPRQQGAGLYQVYDAVTSPAYLLVGDKAGNDGKVKFEFGDDPDRTGVYTGTFSVNNITGEDLTYSLDSTVFTAEATEIDGLEYMGKTGWALHPEVTFRTAAEQVYRYDLNGDGKVDLQDAQQLLKVANGTAPALTGEAASLYDFDASGAISTGDAQIFLCALQGDTSVLDVTQSAYTVPAGGSIEVEVTIALSSQDRAYFVRHYPNGCYIDGYIYVNAADGTSRQMSIPLLAFFGNWTDPSMYDKYILLEDYYDESACGYVYDGYENFLTVRFQGSSTTNYFMPNLFATDEMYLADRNAVSNTSTIPQAGISLIRNAENVSFTIANADTGEVYATVDGGMGTGAYYHNSSTAWSGVTTNKTLNWRVTDGEGQKLPEGTRVSITAQAVPEYYWDRETKQVTGELGHGAFWTTTFTIDNTAPEATSIAMTADLVTGQRSLQVGALDNRYTAAVLVMTTDGQVLVRTAVNQTEPGVEATVDVDISEVYTNHFLVALCDYAGNINTYEVNFGGSVTAPAADTILTAALTDQEGLWFADIDADNLLAITGKNETALDFDLLSAARGADGVLYLASNERDAGGATISSLYTVDEENYTLTKLGTAEAGYCDMAFSPTTAGGTMIAVYGPYALVVDTTTGNYLGAWSLSSYIGSDVSAVGLTYVGTQDHDTYGQMDVFMMLCSDGSIYQTGFAYNAAEEKYVIFVPTAFGQISGLHSGSIAGSSLYCTGEGKLFISALTETGSRLAYVDLTASTPWLFDLGTINTAPVAMYGTSEQTGTDGLAALAPMGQAVEASTQTAVLPQQIQ